MMKTTLRVCISSSFPEHKNRNLGISHHLATGFAQLIGAGQVHLSTYDTVADSVLHYRPNLVVLVGSCLVSVCDYRAIARAARDVEATVAFWSVEDPYEIDANYKALPYADMFLTNDLWAEAHYDHPFVRHLPTAGDPVSHLRPLVPQHERHRDVGFCGVAFRNRQELIIDAATVLRRYKTEIAGQYWPSSLDFARNERIDSRRICDFYATSRVVLNIGRDYALANSYWVVGAASPGPRTYEAALAGCVQLYHLGSHAIEQDFDVGTEILTFETIAELDDKIAWVVDHPREARAIALAAQQRALRDHTYRRRAEQIVSFFQQLKPVSEQAAPVLETMARGSERLVAGLREAFSKKRAPGTIAPPYPVGTGGLNLVRDLADQARDIRDFATAARLYAVYLDSFPDDAAIQLQCAHAYKETRHLNQARHHYGVAVEITPNDADLWLQLGHFNKVSGQLQEALQAYERAMSLEPAHSDARRERDALRAQIERAASEQSDAGLKGTVEPLLHDLSPDHFEEFLEHIVASGRPDLLEGLEHRVSDSALSDATVIKFLEVCLALQHFEALISIVEFVSQTRPHLHVPIHVLMAFLSHRQQRTDHIASQ